MIQPWFPWETVSATGSPVARIRCTAAASLAFAAGTMSSRTAPSFATAADTDNVPRAGVSVRLGGSVLAFNGTAVSNTGGSIVSYKNNQIDLNGANSTPITQIFLQ